MVKEFIAMSLDQLWKMSSVFSEKNYWNKVIEITDFKNGCNTTKGFEVTIYDNQKEANYDEDNYEPAESYELLCKGEDLNGMPRRLNYEEAIDRRIHFLKSRVFIVGIDTSFNTIKLQVYKKQDKSWITTELPKAIDFEKTVYPFIPQ